MKSLRNTFEGYGEIISACILWGFVGILAKMTKDMSPLELIFYRVAFAFIILFIFLSASGNLLEVRLKGKKPYLLLFSILQVATMLAYFVAIFKASVSVAVLLLYTAPVYVTVLSPMLLKEKWTKTGIIALVIATAGILLIVDPGKIDFSVRYLGMLAGIVSGIAYAFQIMTSKYIGDTYSGYVQAFWSFVIGSLILLPVILFVPEYRSPLNIISLNLAYLILLAIFPTILAVSLYFNGLSKVRAANASILGLIEPLSAVILAVIILRESISVLEITGGALILTGAAIVAKYR